MTRITTPSTIAGLLAALIVSFSPLVATAEETAQKTFKSPAAAGEALLASAKANDTDALIAIFGPGSKDLVFSGDPAADASLRERFVAAYEQKHEWKPAPDNLKILIVGKDHWPFPIPLVETESVSHFDTERGREEVLDRRVGRNELSAIQACLAFVDAEREYYAWNPMGGTPQYARAIASADGKKNGLFWITGEGEKPSPLGALFAAARTEGYSAKEGPDAPYHGYRFRVLLKQGEEAHSGAVEYIMDGAMTKGFALLAWPAKYGASGVMTFLVNQTGLVYEKNLGPDTSEITAKIDAFDPDISWDVVSGEALNPLGTDDAS